MADAPNSFKDPFWSSLASRVEAKLDLPPGLLVSVLTKGEHSNADQVSEAGARSPFQIIPKTRKAAIEKFGIDPYLSPQNAAEVAGRLLSGSLKRNNGDAALAVAEYHGGTDRREWGPRTRAYVQRVMEWFPADPMPLPDVGQSPLKTGAPMAPGTSTFDRLSAAMGKPSESQIANVFKAYQSGQMPAADAAQFESDVKSGRVMLPRGAQLEQPEGLPASSGAAVLPASVLAAYGDGRMSSADKAQLEADVRSGIVRLPLGIELRDGAARAAIPGATEGSPLANNGAPPEIQKGPGLLDRVVGAGEAGLAALTGATTGALGMAGGLVKGIADQVASGQFGNPADRTVENAMAAGARAGTYEPRTPSGQAQAAVLGDVMQQALPAVMALPGMVTSVPGGAPKSGAPAAVLAKAGIEGTARDAADLVARPAVAIGAAAPWAAGDVAASAAQGLTDAASAGAARVAGLAKGVTTLPRRAIAALTGTRETAPTPGTLGSAGAAATDIAAQRRATAADLPVPVDLTKGQATRDPAQLKFEIETAKNPEFGGPLRERTVQQNDAYLRNFDNMIDQTGAQAPDLRAVGVSVDAALVNRSKLLKAEIRRRYEAARQAGELEAPVTLDSVVSHLNASEPESATAPLLTTARRMALKTGIASSDADGALVAQPVPLKTAELYRQAIGANTDFAAPNIRQSTIIKGLIDEATDGLGGNLYRSARAARARYAQEFENRAIVAKLVNTVRGTADRKVAIEDVYKHSILNGSLDDVRHLRTVLGQAGPEGAQAWKELQGATLAHIRDVALNSATDSMGNRVLSPAGLDKVVRSLDADGKLDFVLGKQTAQKVRDVRDLALWTKTAPPEAAINTSNTASTIAAAVTDTILSGLSGMPIPAATVTRVALKSIHDSKLRARIADALGQAQKPPGTSVH